jgi:class 3 adenylate cyclase
MNRPPVFDRFGTGCHRQTNCLAVTERLSTRYTRTAEGTYLAYQVSGNGPIDVVLPINGNAAIELIWDEPSVSGFISRLASFSRLITCDPRGFGSSGRLDTDAVPALQTWKDDIGTVMDAVGSERAALLSWGESGGATMFFAATYPERTTSLVLVNAYARYARGRDTPWGMPPDLVTDYVTTIQEVWGTGQCAEILAPAMVTTDEARRHWARIERLTASPDVLAAMTRAVLDSDVTPVLPAIQAPTLVISRRGDRHVRHEHGRHVAGGIDGARLVELSGDDHLPFAGHSEELLDEVEEFLTGSRPAAVLDRVLVTVLFTDIVGSTEHVARLGDRRWREALNRYDTLVRHLLERYKGRHVKTTGDGTLATFDGPARAVECGRAIASRVIDLGFEIRAGLHTGEVESRGEDVAGMAVHIAARVANVAAASEVLVSSTVKDLVTGSGIGFEDHGEHGLKGVPDTWRLFRVAP